MGVTGQTTRQTSCCGQPRMLPLLLLLLPLLLLLLLLPPLLLLLLTQRWMHSHLNRTIWGTALLMGLVLLLWVLLQASVGLVCHCWC